MKEENKYTEGKDTGWYSVENIFCGHIFLNLNFYDLIFLLSELQYLYMYKSGFTTGEAEDCCQHVRLDLKEP